MVDSGAGCSLVTKGLIEMLKPVKLTSPDRVLRDASQNAIELVGKTRLPIRIIGSKDEFINTEVDFYVSNSENTNCVLLGRNFMKIFGSTEFNFESNRIKLGHIWCNGLEIKESRVKLIRDAIIPATTEKFIRVKGKTGNGLVQAEFAPDTLINYPGIYVAKARVIPNSCGEFQIALINTTDSDVNLKRRKYLGRLTPCALTVPEIACINSFNQTKIVMGEETPTGERQELLGLLNDFKDVFAENPKKPKLVTNTTHKIVTVSTPPIFRKPYPIPYARRDEVNSQLQEMLENEVI